MITIREYVRPASLEEAWTLNQKRTSRVIGGMLWLKMQNAAVGTAIDLSGLGLDKIEETPEGFAVGAMVSLRALETHAGLNEYTNGAMREALRHIVGVQFRNTATLGGSVYGRFGFSDVLTVLLALNASVELYKGGIVPLAQFAEMPFDRDILVRVHIPKENAAFFYQSVRPTKTDFPALTCAACGRSIPLRCRRAARKSGRAHAAVRAGRAAGDRERAGHDWLQSPRQRGIPEASRPRARPPRRGRTGRRREVNITFTLNNKAVSADIAPDTLLLDLVRRLGCKSVKRGCGTGNCGLCTVYLDGTPILSCATLAARVQGRSVTTLEGLQSEAAEFGAFLADQGAEQCGFCNSGFIMNTLALLRENPDPDEDEIREYLAGNLCRCSGYEGQLRGIQSFLAWKKAKEASEE